jgi:hypothetical protein
LTTVRKRDGSQCINIVITEVSGELILLSIICCNMRDTVAAGNILVLTFHRQQYIALTSGAIRQVVNCLFTAGYGYVFKMAYLLKS